ncbi:Coiled-coil domain-containing protein 63 [Trichoplax sp. H2]|nr:Coiled-coil domain-containing protein 63 [Trichoplax sp. H2]|eukprot:RDD40524.1 Coiled-coil domain-containing protein 63 [Trichoplax sp. H2]
MQRVQSRRSEVSESEVDGLVEQELAKLQRQYRIMEGDRKAYSEESQNLIRKQRASILALQKENEMLMKDFKIAAGKQKEAVDNDYIDRIRQELSKEDEFQEMIKEEKDLLNQLTGEVKAVEKQINEQRKKMGGAHIFQEHTMKTQKQTRVLQNRLDKALVKFNSTLADNAKLREAIDHLRSERIIFENIYKKLEKQLIDYKRKIGGVIEESTQAYDARDEAQSKMMALKEKNEKDLAQYNLELKELMRIIDHDRKLKNFMGVKGQERLEEEILSARKKKKSESDKPQEKGIEETVESYEEAFERIKEATSIQDIDLLVSRFIEVEDKNFALFNYVNELNNEIETLQEQITGVRDDIEKFKGQGMEMENQRKAILKELEGKLNMVTEKANQFDKQYRSTQKILEQLKSGITSLFSKINCDKSAISDMLGGTIGVTETNMMQYLGIVEQRTNELLQMQSFVSVRDSDRVDGAQIPTLLGQGPQQPTANIVVVPPTTGDDYESEASTESDDDSRPLTQNELKAKIMKGISKREAQPKTTEAPPSPTKPVDKKKKSMKKSTSTIKK